MSKFSAFFVSADLHPRTVTLADGSRHELHFKELPAATFRKFQWAERSADPDVRAGSMAALIAACLCEPDGQPAMTYQQALLLKPGAANALIEVVLQVNGVQAAPGEAEAGNA